MLVAYAGLYSSPWQPPVDAWWTWALLFGADDVAYYRLHRSHEVRVLWASHVVHGSFEAEGERPRGGGTGSATPGRTA